MLARFPFVGARMALFYTTLEFSLLLSPLHRQKVGSIPLVFLYPGMGLLFASTALFLAWLACRAPVERLYRRARAAGIPDSQADYASHLVELTQCVSGTEGGSDFWDAIYVGSNTSFVEHVEERAIKDRCGQDVQILRRERTCVNGDLYDLVFLTAPGGEQKRLVFDVSAAAEPGPEESALLASSPSAAGFLRDIAPQIEVLTGRTPGVRIARRTLGAACGVIAHLFFVMLAFVAFAWGLMGEAELPSGAGWLLWLVPPGVLLIGRPLRKYRDVRRI
jgi:hypothetical protein